MSAEYTKFIKLLEAYEKILHPDFFNPLKHGIAKVYSEAKAEAVEHAIATGKFSERTLAVDRIVKEAEERRRYMCADGQEDRFWRRSLFRSLITYLESNQSKTNPK